MKYPLLHRGELRLPTHISSELETIHAEVEITDHLRAVRSLSAYLADPNAHVRSKLLLLELLIHSEPREIEPLGATRTTTKLLLLCLAFCTGDYFQDNMEPLILWELRDTCALKVQQQRDNKWRADPWIETQRLCFEGSSSLQPTKEDLEDLYQLYMDYDIVDPLILGSLFHLRSRDHTVVPCTKQGLSHTPNNNEAVKHVAVFLSRLGLSEKKKIAALSFLLLNTEESRQAYQFCMDADIDTSLFEERAFFLWELRAICLYERQLQEMHHDKVMRAAGIAADVITSTADGLHAVLSETTELATTGMLSASEVVANHVLEKNGGATVHPEIEQNTKASVVVRTYSGAAKRATDQVRTVAAGTSRQIRDVSAHHIRQAATKVPLPAAQKTNLQAATHVAMACLGATATVGEAVFQSTGNLARGATKAVSNVVQHKYGDTAGQVVQDVGDTVGNVIRTASHVALLTGQKSLPKSVAKTTARQHRSVKQTPGTGEDASSVVAETGLKPPVISDTSMTEDESFSTTSSSSSMVEDNDSANAPEGGRVRSLH